MNAHQPRNLANSRASVPSRRSRRALIRATGATLLTGAAAPVAFPRFVRAQEAATPTPPGPPIPPEISGYAVDWPAPQGNLAAHRATADSAISAETVDQLQVAWEFPLTAESGYGAMTAIPLIVGETIYVQDMVSDVYALDRATGAVRWQHVENLPSAGPNGVAVGYGMVFAATGFDAGVFALNAETGAEIWRSNLSANPAEFTLIQPLVHDNVVYASTSPAAYVGGSRGILFALDAHTGDVLWQWDTTTDNLWGAARLNSGGGVWYPPSVDDQGNIFFGTGNPAPWPEFAGTPTTRPGPNRYTSSMVSLNTTTGAMRWFVQAKPHDRIDHDFQHTPVLATVEIAGVPTPLAIGAGKTGTVIAAHADTGDVIWSVPVGQHTPYGDGAELTEALATPIVVAPGFFGGVESPIAFAKDTVFVPVVNLPFIYDATSVDFDLANATGEMVALNAVDGSLRWSTPVSTFFAGGATVANDLVFGGGLDGIVRGFDTQTGSEVWQFEAGAGINAPFAIAGDLLLVPAGGFLITGETPPPTAAPALLAFRLTPATNPAATPVATPTP